MSKRKSNPGFGRAFLFFGKFKSKILARRSEREHPGSFIIERDGYYYVVKQKTFRRNAKRSKRNPYFVEFVRTPSMSRVVMKRGYKTRSAAWKKARSMPKRKDGFWSVIEEESAIRALKHTAAVSYVHGKKNPSRGVLIYGRVLKIFAQKTQGPYKGQRFVHTFKKGAIMVGMPDGSLRISHP